MQLWNAPFVNWYRPRIVGKSKWLIVPSASECDVEFADDLAAVTAKMVSMVWYSSE